MSSSLSMLLLWESLLLIRCVHWESLVSTHINNPLYLPHWYFKRKYCDCQDKDFWNYLRSRSAHWTQLSRKQATLLEKKLDWGSLQSWSNGLGLAYFMSDCNRSNTLCGIWEVLLHNPVPKATSTCLAQFIMVHIWQVFVTLVFLIFQLFF